MKFRKFNENSANKANEKLENSIKELEASIKEKQLIMRKLNEEIERYSEIKANLISMKNVLFETEC